MKRPPALDACKFLGVRWATMTLSILLACGNEAGDVVGPPGPPAPVFQYVRQMIQDPWFAESLPGRLGDRPAAIPIHAAIRVDLRMAVESLSLARLDRAFASLEGAVDSYRTRPALDPADRAVLAVFELFVGQARGIRTGTVPWSPAPLLRKAPG